MDNVFTLGISSLWDEVCHMPVGGVWWLNVDRYADAVSLFNQTLAAQAKNSHVAALVMGNKPKDIISLDHTHGRIISRCSPCRIARRRWRKYTAI